MRFAAAAEATPEIEGQVQPGLQALSNNDRKMILIDDGRRLDGSVDLDNVFRAAYPSDPRWDYAIGIKINASSSRVVFVEPHPASSASVTDVLKKFEWLTKLLSSEATELGELPACYVWLATGSVWLPPSSPQRRRLASRGLLFAARKLQLHKVP